MNKEIVKAMNKKETKIDKVRKWWRKNDYKVLRVILFPIWWYVEGKEKINTWLNSKTKWSEERANEILCYYIPRSADWSEEEKCFYYFNNGMGWTSKSHLKKIKIKDRRFWKRYYSKIRMYLIENFELENFTKETGDCSQGWTEVTFKLKTPIDKYLNL